MSSNIILGAGAALEQACQLGDDLGLDYARLEVCSADGHNFVIEPLLQLHAPADHAVFVALDERAVNYARLKLIASVRLAGYRSFNLVSPYASVASDLRLLGNVLVGAGTRIAPGCALGMGSWLGHQVVLERGVILGSCVTLHSAVVLGEAVTIGTGSTLGTCSHALAGSVIGKHCEWLLAEQLPPVLPDRSFYDQLMPEGARILRL